MARALVDISKDQEKHFNNYVSNLINQYIQQEIDNYGEQQAKINLINNKDIIIVDNIMLKDLKEEEQKNTSTFLSFKYYYNFTSEDNLYYIINNIYLKQYQDYFKTYKIQEKANKENAKTIIYNEITENIEENLDKHDLDDIISYIKTNDYKKLLIKSINEEYEIDINILNDIYTSCLNKAIAPYKEDLKICIDNKKYEDKLQQERLKQKQKEQQDYLKARKNKIPLGWKMYGITKAINKMIK